jgi:hypothetical protein
LEGLWTKRTSRLLGVSAQAIRRLRTNIEDYSREFHDEYVQQIEATALQVDERYGYVGSKGDPLWEATALEPQSRLLIGFIGGRRDQRLIKELMASSRERLHDPSDLVLMPDGARSLRVAVRLHLRPAIPAGAQGRQRPLSKAPPPDQPRSRPLSGSQTPQKRLGSGGECQGGAWLLQASESRALEKLGYQAPNLCAIERQNATARKMNAYLLRRSLAFGRTQKSREALGWFSTVGLQLLPDPETVGADVERFGGQTVLPAAHASDGGGPDRLDLDGGRAPLYTGLCGRGYAIITRNYQPAGAPRLSLSLQAPLRSEAG